MMMRDRVLLVDARPEDERTLWLMLTFAASMGVGGELEVATAKADPYLRCYVDGWGSHAGDLGVIARNVTGQDLGAAWLRSGREGGPLRVGDDRIPELATAVLPRARGRGIGTLMMTRLVQMARGRFPEIVLSVRDSNPAAAFYARLGFRETGRIENRVGGCSLVMKLDLSAAAPGRPRRG